MALASKVTKPPMQIRRFVFSTILTKLARMKVARFTGHPWEARNNSVIYWFPKDGMSEDNMKVSIGWVVDLSAESILWFRVRISRNASQEVAKFIILESVLLHFSHNI
jgi:hypothetical protein